MSGLNVIILAQDDFLTYNDNTNGFTIQYPSTWEIANQSGKNIVLFKSPLENSSDIFQETVGIRVVDLTGGLSLDNFTNTNIKSLEQSANILDSTPVTLADKPAHKILYSTNDERKNIMQAWTLIGNKVYLITYVSDATKYLDFLPTVQKMIDSFEIIAPSETNTATDGGQQEEQQPRAMEGFLVYEDITNKFTVQYPANWQKQENVYGTHGVQFSPTATDRDNVLIDVLTQPGLTLDSWTQEKLASIRSREGSQIIHSSPTLLSGSPAYEATYIWEGDKIMELWTVVGDRLYAISYVAVGEEKFQKYLADVKKMLDSFMIMTTIGTTFDTNGPPLSPPVQPSAVAPPLRNISSSTLQSTTTAATQQSNFRPHYDTFVEPGSVQGYGIYKPHNPPNVFRPDEIIELYIEPLGYTARESEDSDGETLYSLEFGATIVVKDKEENVLSDPISVEFDEELSALRFKPAQVFIPIEFDADEPLPAEDYIFEYTIIDEVSGNNFKILKDIRIEDEKAASPNSLSEYFEPQSSSSPSSITIQTDRSEYQDQDVVTISGKVSDAKPREILSITVLDPDGSQYKLGYVDIKSDGSYRYRFTIDGESTISGQYKVIAEHANAVGKTSFNFVR